MSARGDLRVLSKMVHFHNIVDLEYIMDVKGKTLIHLGVLDNSADEKSAGWKECVNLVIITKTLSLLPKLWDYVILVYNETFKHLSYDIEPPHVMRFVIGAN
ncbi:hypothetical protein G9A89_023776 [Geosiphon pyriformis]|nr:hypothetical protein G9A89_023776 [Geosiphon pyriformis]